MSDTVALNYRETGSDQPVFILHGMFGSLSNLGLLGRSLTEHYRVIMVDLRNHGDSPHHPEMNYPVMADDIVRLMDNLNIESAHLIGHSMGGKIAMQVALNQPQRVNKLIVADIAPVLYKADRHDEILEGLSALHHAPLASRKEADQVLAQFVDEAGVRAFLLTNLARDKQTGTLRLKLNIEAVIDNYFDQLTLAPTGTAYSGSTLFIRGADSNYIQERNHQVIFQLFPNAKIETIENTGHWLHAEKPAEFNQLVQHFLKTT